MRNLMILAAGILALAALPASAEEPLGDDNIVRQRFAALGTSTPGETFTQRFDTSDRSLARVNKKPYGMRELVYWTPPPAKNWKYAVIIGAKHKAPRLQRVVRVNQRPVQVAQTARTSNRNEFAENFADELKGRALTHILGKIGVPYAGSASCSLLTFAGFVQDGVRDGEKWTPTEVVGNIFLSTKNCIIPIDDLANAKSAPEFVFTLGFALASFAVPPPYGLAVGPLRSLIIPAIQSAGSSQPATASATRYAQEGKRHKKVATQ